MMMTTESLVIHPVVVVKVSKIICQTLLDKSAGSSYISAALQDQLKLKFIKKVTKKYLYDMFSTTRIREFKIYLYRK